MPFYEYQCNHCGHALEAMQKISDSPLKKCPNCGKPQLQRLMSAPVFRLKGGGWYETDFKSDKDNKRNLADRPEAEAPKEDKPKEDKKETAEAGSKDTRDLGVGKKARRQAGREDRSAEAAKKPADGADSRRSASGPSSPKARPSAQRSTAAKRPSAGQAAGEASGQAERREAGPPRASVSAL